MLVRGVVLGGMVHAILIIVMSLALVSRLSAQDAVGPEIPIILEHADSLVGSGPMGSAIRTFIGNVRFAQGNVTGRCDKVLHDVTRNSVELTGSVEIRQGDLTITAPAITYEGSSSIATATSGIRVQQKDVVVTSRAGSYDLRRRLASFRRDVHAVDDSVKIWCDSLEYDRDRDTMLARGNVQILDSTGNSWFRSDVARRDAAGRSIELNGSAQAWSWSTDSVDVADTTYIAGDKLQSGPSSQGGSASLLVARGNVQMVRGSTASSSGALQYDDAEGVILLTESPTVWSDSSVLQAATITAESKDRELRTVTGTGKAVLLSPSDTLMPARFDQIAGNTIVMRFVSDTVRTLRADGDAVSITFRKESGERKGLAKVAADTIEASIISDEVTDVIWLGGVSGESHPERLVLDREAEFLLPGVRIPDGRPQYVPCPSRRSVLR